MSFMQRLCETYDNIADLAGVDTAGSAAVLSPVEHQLIKAHITVTLGPDGALVAAEAAEDSGSIVPVTEASASRTGPLPHPLVDKLEYLAGDYDLYGHADKPSRPKFDAYIAQLQAWCDSPHTHPKLRAIFAYLSQGRLIEDLVRHKVLHLGEDGRILNAWPGNKDDAPPVFKIKNVKPADMCVRFRVEGTGRESRAWLDRSLHESFIRYIAPPSAGGALCYVSGDMAAPIRLHPKSIVRVAANAKLVSSNDSAGLTYRGRLLDADEAQGMSREVAQKAYAALKWLIDSRALLCDKQALIAFGTGGQLVPPPTEDTEALVREERARTNMDILIAAQRDTAQQYAALLNQAILSYSARGLGQRTPVVVMALDSATPGRLSVSLYRELEAGDYLESVKRWHQSCAWLHTYYKDRPFYGAPSLRDIAKAAYGEKVDPKQIGSVIERLIPCVLDGAPLPADIVNAAVRRASQPMALERWEWEKALSIACALYRKQHEKEGYSMSQLEERTDRDFLYGRMLAVADWAERSVLIANKESRPTNAMRLMTAFSQHPFQTWKHIEEGIHTYLMKLEEKPYGAKYRNLLTEISKVMGDGYEDNASLSGSYLHGFHCQRYAFLKEVEANVAKKSAKGADAPSDATESEEETP